MANVWNFLFLNGEFAPRTYILEGMTLQQVGTRPTGASHSIYEELWHTAFWQRIVLERDEEAIKRWEEDDLFPPSPEPADEAAWQMLVNSFLASSERAVELAQDEVWLNTEAGADNPGFTWRNALEQLAVHNAYHLGKIVLLRQLLGCWTPRPKPNQPQ
ncbi:DinB family protein [Deinococcus rubellus]|uniref:DinB family protein n=1 Tax=Deinococcus rubellus TaxID=1889240 RepID=A0ABY5YGF1_9DEIO|nr:DinB family protein [Deinococcus rubellus]UWX64129.1 DinB family protein [Deinococcus rubellus]